jgi:hypothetical protein
MIVRIVHGSVAAVAVNRPLTLSRSHRSDSRLTATEGKLARSLRTGERAEEVRAIRSEGLRDRGLGLDESLLRSTSLAELEDAAADGTTVESGRVARWGLVIRRADDDRLDGLLSGHGRGILRRCDLLGLLLGEVGSDGGLEPQLRLGFGGANEGLEDLWVVGLKDDVAAS